MLWMNNGSNANCKVVYVIGRHLHRAKLFATLWAAPFYHYPALDVQHFNDNDNVVMRRVSTRRWNAKLFWVMGLFLKSSRFFVLYEVRRGAPGGNADAGHDCDEIIDNRGQGSSPGRSQHPVSALHELSIARRRPTLTIWRLRLILATH
ncbi:hypothetical protein J6590_021616 [Homalodisca vitripennis]|nr:hypothetical protein J6590_021616 [Homalodisca vitripennis]